MTQGGAEDRGRWYVLFVMTLAYALNIADRFVLSTLIEPIKAGFALSDSAVGFLTGTALAVFYVTAGLPLGALADRGSRRNLLVISLAGWSFMTVVCGISRNYWQLLLARIGVGIGEAGGTPASQSLLADRFRPERRALVMSIFALGASLGAALGSTGAGWLNDRYGWRMVLVVFGLGGIPTALLVLLTIKEPKRGLFDSGAPETERASLLATLRFIWSQKSLVHILIGATVLTFWGWGLLWWTPAFLVRSHHLSVGAASALLGPMHGIGGSLLMLLTAWAMSGAMGRATHRQAWFIAVTTLAGTVPSIIAYHASSLEVVRLALWVFVPITYIYIGPTLALTQNLVPPGMRAQACAVFLLVANLANLAVAPQAIGLASDWVARAGTPAQDSLRYVLIATAFTGLWAAYHYGVAAKYLKNDFAKAATRIAPALP